MTKRLTFASGLALAWSAAALVSCGGPNGGGGPMTPGGGNGPSSPNAPTRTNNPGLCAPTNAFSYALCVCEDFADAGQLIVGRGPSGAGSVGVNGTTMLANHAVVSGSFVSLGNWSAGTGADIEGDLRSGADLRVAGAVEVGGDVAAGADLTGAGVLTVGGALRVAGRDIFLGVSEVSGGRGAFDGPTQPPCGCAPGTVFDVVQAVAQARTANDNAVLGLSPGALLDIGLTRITLPTGRYYFQGATTIGRNRLQITGNVSLYIDGNLDQIGYDDIVLAPGATLDLYVSGALRMVGYTPAGNPQSPASFRIYVGGSDRLSVSIGRNEFYGSIYAPSADVAIAGSTIVVGSVFAKQVVAAGQLIINYGGAVPACTPPVSTPSDPPPDPPVPAPDPIVP